MRHRKSRRKSGSPEENDMLNLIENLMAFDEFRKELLPALQQDAIDGVPPEKLREKYQSYLTARLIQIGLVGKDGDALAAIRDISDRAEGKPAQTNVHINKYEQLPDEQLDAALKSQIEDLEDLLN